MDVKMQTSFIPKKPIVESRLSGSGISLFLLLAIIIFIVAIAASVGVWLWQKSLVSQLEKDKQALVAAKDSYEENTINPLIRLDDRIEETKTLLVNHLSVTPVFKLIEDYTVKNVQLKGMKFSFGGEQKIKIELSGVAKNYDALSGQADVFNGLSAKSIIFQPIISDFNLNPDGTVSFNFNALVNSKLVSYENTLIGGTGDTGNSTTTTITPQ